MKLLKNSLLMLSIAPFLTGSDSIENERSEKLIADSWKGTISYSYTLIDNGKRDEAEAKSEWKNLRIAAITIDVKGNGKGYAYMSDKLDKWQQTTTPYIKNTKAIQIITEKETGIGEGVVEVGVEINKEAGTYWLKTDGPQYHVQRRARLWSSIIEMAGGQQPEDTSSRINDGIPIDAPDQRIGNNPNELNGNYVIFSSATHHVTVSWRLVKQITRSGAANTNSGTPSSGNTSSTNNSGQGNQPSTNPSGQTTSNNPHAKFYGNAELIVSPENYQEWKPEAGGSTSVPGNKLKTNLLFRNIGNISQLKVVSFELKLFSTTSTGLSSTSSNDLDIRFLPSKSSVLSDDGQLIKIQCADGFTGETIIGSFHNKGSAILVAEAILNNGMRIKGNLLVSGGPTEIPIPINNDPKN